MLNSITIKNFRKHTDSTFSFDDGLHVMRGMNEAGKSTVLEAVGYALFGVKALRSPLAEAVTWDQPENTLRVTLTLTVDGVQYVVSRGKSGAEINYDGGIVTGQTEVTSFLAGKLKVDSGSAPKLMLSSQMDIRGALEAGPKATTDLIERLAEFDQIDRLIDLMQEKLTLGNTSTASAQLESARERLDALSAEVEPDIASLELKVTSALGCLELANSNYALQDEAYHTTMEAYSQARANQQAHRDALSRAEQAAADLDSAEDSLWNLKEHPVEPTWDSDDRIQRLLAFKADENLLRQRRAAHQAVKGFLGKLDNLGYFNGSVSVFNEHLAGNRAKLDEAKDAIRANDVKLATLRSKLNNDSCTFCGKDFSDLPEVRAKNEATQAEIDEVIVQSLKMQSLKAASEAAIAALNKIWSDGKLIGDLASSWGAYVEVDGSTVPPVLAWMGDVPEPAGDLPDYDAEIRSIRAKVKAHADWLTLVAQATDRVATFKVADERAKDAVSALTDAAPDVDAAQAAHFAASQARQEAAETRDEYRDSVRSACSVLDTAVANWERVVQSKARASEAVDSALKALNELEFNNALLKRVRTARPIIADKLWNLVLAAVGTYFSEMRGTRSVVTKTSDGFLVDGHPVASLSGSTLDILGLAIRVALVRTFLPSAPFLILDEPCASMDTARTESLLGFLVSVGFKQVILVTHEDVSESVADHIITIGE